MRFEDAASAYLLDAEKMLRPTSYGTYVHLLRLRILPYFRQLEIEQIDNQKMQDFLDSLVQQGRGIHVIRDCISLVKLVLRHSKRCGSQAQTMFDIEYPRTVNRQSRRDFLSDVEFETLLKYCSDHLNRCISILIAMTTGMRIGEVCGLQWGDVDFATCTISVSRSVKRTYIPGETCGVEVSRPKTDSSTRVIPLPKATLDALVSLGKKEDNCYIETGTEKPTEPRTLRQKYCRVLKACGLKHHTFHALRHTFASRCINSGGDARTVADILGHKSVEMTLNVYTHSSDRRRRQVAEMGVAI